MFSKGPTHFIELCSEESVRGIQVQDPTVYYVGWTPERLMGGMA